MSDIKTYVYGWGVSAVLCNKTVKKGFLMSYSMQNKSCNIPFMHACIYFCLFIYLCACCRSMLSFNLIFSCCKWKIEPIKGLLRVKGLSSPLLFFFFFFFLPCFYYILILYVHYKWILSAMNLWDPLALMNFNPPPPHYHPSPPLLNIQPSKVIQRALHVLPDGNIPTTQSSRLWHIKLWLCTHIYIQIQMHLDMDTHTHILGEWNNITL